MAGLTIAPSERDLFKIVMAVRQLMEGRSNATGTFTLTNGATTTSVTAPNCGPSSIVLFSPQTANAAAQVATTYVPPATVVAGSFVVNHANPGNTTSTFGWVALG